MTPQKRFVCFVILFIVVAFSGPAHGSFREFQLWRQDMPSIPGSAASEDFMGSALAQGDFNGDGYADLAVGVPGRDIDAVVDAGGVYVLYGSSSGPSESGIQLWHQGVEPHIELLESGDSFGEALAAGDFNGDGYDDLAVGAPRESLSTIPEMGSVSVFYGSVSGLTAQNRTSKIQYTSPREGDNFHEAEDYFGLSLAAGDFNGDGFADLAAGVPGEDLGSIQDAGAVNVLYGAATGLTFVADAGNQFWHQDVPGVEDAAETGDRFGYAVSAGDFNGDGYADLAVGVSREGIGGTTASGAVNVLYGSHTGLGAAGNQFWHQDSPGVSDEAVSFEYFGESLARGDFDGDGYDDLAIAVHSETIGDVLDAGALHVLYGTPAGLSVLGEQFWHQGVEGISSSPGEFEFFASELAAGDFNGDGYDDLASGVPFEQVNAASFAGAVNLIFGSATGLSAQGNQFWHQDSPGVPDSAEFNEGFGSALAAGDFDGDGLDDLAAGTPFENIENGGTLENAGAVHVLLSGLTRLIFPYAASSGGWDTEICVINTQAGPLSGKLKGYDSGGTLLASTSVSLNGYGRYAVSLASAFPAAAASMRYCVFESPSDLVEGYTKFALPGLMRGAVPASTLLPTGKLLLPHVGFTDAWWTGLGMVNTPDVRRSRTLSFNTGDAFTLQFAGKSQTTLTIDSLFSSAPSGTVESAVLDAAPGLLAMELFGSGNLLAGVRISDATSTILYYPHVAPGGGAWWTGLAAYNPGAASNTLTITAYSEGGEVLATETATLPPGGKLLNSVQGLGLPSSTAWVKIEGSQPLTGLELFGTADGNQLAGFTVVDLAKWVGILPKIDDAGWTGIALVNTFSDPVTVRLEAYDDSGALLAAAMVPLGGHAKILGTPQALFAPLDVSSATYITFISASPVAAFQLNGSFDGMMLDALPGM